MKIEVSAQTEEQVRKLAKETYDMMIPCYSYDGLRLQPAPAIQLRDTIIQKMIDPSNLLRLQINFPADGPDDRWIASCEMMLGHGIVHNDKRYRILGGSSSVKKGHFWMATDDVRESIHRYFKTSQEALSYLGVLFSSCHHGIHQLTNIKGRVVKDGVAGTSDGQGFISTRMVAALSVPDRQTQVRMVCTENHWVGKGTLLPADLPHNCDFILPESMIKGAGSVPLYQPWNIWFGIRDIATTRKYSSSFSFAQWFTGEVLDSVFPVVEGKLDIIKNALHDRDAALKFLGLVNHDDDSNDARTKVEAFLQAGVGPDHKWVRRQLMQLIRKEYCKLATGGGFELEGRMGAFAELSDDVVCIRELPEGPVVLSRYPVRDPHSILAVWNEPGCVSDAKPGTIYLNKETAMQVDGDFDGDYYFTCSQEPVVNAVASLDWYPSYQRVDAPPKTRLKDPLSALPYAAVRAVGNRIGSITYAISGAVHAGNLNKVAKLSAGLQAEVQSLKWDTKADRELLNDPDMQIPDYIAETKHDRKLFVQHAEHVEGYFPLIQNYNRVVDRWQQDTCETTPLVHFKSMIPIWMEPGCLDLVEEVTAVIKTYNKWVASIIQKNPEPSQAELEGPLGFLQSWDGSKTENRRAWATAVWHVVHGSRADTTGSAAFHLFSDEMVALMMENASSQQTVKVPVRKGTIDTDMGMVLPLVGGMKIAGEKLVAFKEKVMSLNDPACLTTKSISEGAVSFWMDHLYLGRLPKDNIFYGSVPAGLQFQARLQLRGKTVYMIPAESNWMTSLAN